MPASEFDWATLTRGQIFPVYGTKRKAAEDTSVAGMHNCQSQQEIQEQIAKRRCHWSQFQQPEVMQGTPPVDMSTLQQDVPLNNNNNNNMTIRPGLAASFSTQCNEMELNHNSPAMEDQHQIFEQQQKHQQVSHPALSQVMSQQPPRVPSPWPSHQPIYQPQAQDAYIMDMNGETFNSESPAAAADMETACSNMESDFTPDQQQYHSTSERIGDRSPTSGRIRCYCKPSWEGMLDMKPYVSDVY